MSTPRKTAPERELRRLAIAGRWDDVRELLLARIAQDDTDTEAKDELKRLEEGLPLKAMMNAAQRHEAAKQDAAKAIADFMEALPLAELKKLSKSELPEVCKTWEELSSTYRRYHKKLTESMIAYRSELRARRSKYRGILFNKASKIALLAVAFGGAVFGVNHYLKTGAIKEYEAFASALNSKNINSVLELKDKVNSGIHLSELLGKGRLRSIGVGYAASEKAHICPIKDI